MNVRAARTKKDTAPMKMTLSTSRNRFQQMQEETFEVNPHSPIKLYEGPTIDTTDRSLVSYSQTQRFDPSGFRFDRPLQKDIFHTDPYITCSNCNYLNFVDVVTIRRMLSLPAAVSEELRLAPEILPPCAVCQHSDCFVVGSHDFTEQVQQRIRMAMQKEQRERNAASAIQQGYRRYLRRMYGSALCDMFLANKYLKYLAAMKITAVARGRLGRRIVNTERALVTIKNSHPLLIRHSLRTSLKGPKVFWYKRQIEIDMLYANYLELVKKTGFIPPRKLVEANIIEIARRIIARQSQLIVLVQRRWRGFMARRIVRYFRTEISRLFQFRVARVMKIQRVYRGHAVRLSIPTLIREWERKETMEDYLSTSKDASMYGSKFKIADQVMGFYQVERSEEKSARYTSRVASAHHYDMKKMHAFWDSPYADERLTLQTDRLLNIEYGLIKREKDAINAEHDRKMFMEQRIHERGPTGFGLRSVATVKPPSSYYYNAVLSPEELGESEHASTGINLSSNMLASVAVGGDTINSVVSSRSKSFRIYFQGEIHHLAELIVERMQHDFSKKGISKRFKAHNDERLKRLETRLRIEQRAERALLATTNVHESPLKAKLRRSSITSGAASNAHLNTTPSNAHLNAAPSSSHMDVSHIPTRLGRETSASAAPRFGTADGKRKGSTLSNGGDDHSAGGKGLNHSVSALALPDIKNGKLVKPSKKVDKYLRGNFKYPEHIYFNAMEWLYEDYDVKKTD